MKIWNTLRFKLVVSLLLLCAASSSWGSCKRATSSLQADSAYSALIPFGKINLTDTYFMPPGSLLDSVVVPSTNYTTRGATGSTVLWECDEEDLPDIYFLIATNGDDRVGGNVDIGGPDGLTDVYATWFAYVGIRQTMSGVVVTHIWQKIPITTYATSGDKIQIRLQDIPPLQAELFRVSSLPPTGIASFCSGIAYASTSGTLYSCTEPNSYIQLSGNDNVSFSFGHDQPGDDCATKYKFWGSDNGFGYGMRTANKLYSNPTCVARSVTPLVMFPPLSVDQLEAGDETSGNFSVRVECSDSVTSGVSDTQTALGIQVSEGAYSAASTLGLVNSSGGVSTLVSDNYFDEGVAQGVGITIANGSDPGTSLTLVGQPGIATLTPGGNAAGWYPVLQGATKDGSSTSGYTTYSYNFIATLKKLNGQTVTPGKVHATAYVLVKMQ